MSVRCVARTAVPALLALALIAPDAGAASGDRTSSSAPTNLRITASTSSSVTLAWDAPRSGSGVAYYTLVEKSTWNYFHVSASNTSYTRTRLAPNINHSWVVRAVDKTGRASAESNTVSSRTPSDVTPPSTPTLSAPFVGPTRIQLDWTDSVDDTSAVDYSVNIDGSQAQTTTLSETVVANLAPSTSYSLTVTARDKWGNPSTSNTLLLTTAAAGNDTAPTAPANLRGFEVSGCEAWLSWDASTDDVDPPSAIRYDVYVNGEFDSGAFGLTSTFLYATRNGTNVFTVVASDSSGNESPPSVVEIPNMWLC